MLYVSRLIVASLGRLGRGDPDSLLPLIASMTSTSPCGKLASPRLTPYPCRPIVLPDRDRLQCCLANRDARRLCVEGRDASQYVSSNAKRTDGFPVTGTALPRRRRQTVGTRALGRCDGRSSRTRRRFSTDRPADRSRDGPCRAPTASADSETSRPILRASAR